MCGTGRVSIPLIKAGYKLTCVDYSPDMLKMLRSKLPENSGATVDCQDISSLSLNEKFDLAIIPFHSFSEITDKKKRDQAIQRIFYCLLPGGTYFCTLYNPDYRVKFADGNMKCLGEFEIGEDRKLIVTYFNSYIENLQMIKSIQFYEIFDSHNRLIEKRFLDIQFSLITKEEMKEAGRKTGFQLRKIYGDYNRSPFSQDSMFMNFEFVK
jgi:SAM-dependent methyltransferase